MKINEEKMILKIKKLAEEILLENTNCSQAQSIIDICDVIDCEEHSNLSNVIRHPFKGDSIIGDHVIYTDNKNETSAMFEKAMEEQHGK